MNRSNDVPQYPLFVNDYLRKSSACSRKLDTGGFGKYNNVVVIPAISEYKNILVLFESICEIDPKYFDETLFLFVVNNTDNASREIREDNKITLDFFGKIIRKEYHSENLIGKIIGRNINVGYVDASSEGNELPQKDGGVGLARKIGMDTALTVFDYRSQSKKILIQLDADCVVAKNYLTEIIDKFNKNNYGAGYVAFEHQLPDSEPEKLAILCYEIFLRYYVLGLSFANSPFAFPSIGSTMVCDAERYCKAGGMNKRKAGEDFYFMEKLAKTTKIYKIGGTKVYPSGRESWRVPFGTGPRITRFLLQSQNEYLLYNPKSFEILKEWLKIFNSIEHRHSEEYLSKAEVIHPVLKEFFKLNKFEDGWRRILRNSKSNEQLQKQKIMWFDGFRTMKLIHFLRDSGFPQVSMFDAIDELLTMMKVSFNIPRKETIPNPETQIEYLNLLRNLV